MNYKDFTPTAQRALKAGSDIAKAQKHSSIDNVHILKGILSFDTTVTPYILRRAGTDLLEFETKIDQILANLPLRFEEKPLEVSAHVETSLNLAKQISKEVGDEVISVEHILSGILLTSDKIADWMKSKGIDKQKLETFIKELRNTPQGQNSVNESKYPNLDMYGVNLTAKVKSGATDPVIGRIDEIRRVLQIISRRTKNNPLIIGEPGVGKTSIVEGLAQRIEKGDAPENLKNSIIYALDLGAVVAGASKQGQMEERLRAIIKEVKDSAGEIILFIDELHLLVSMGGGQSGAADILKPALARGELKAIGATTLNEYKKYIEKDKALVRRFQNVMVEEPTVPETVSILRGIKEKYENFHKVRITDDALVAAAELSHRYISERFLPDKAIDLIDETASKLKIEINTLPDEIDKIERQINQFKIEKEILKHEDNPAALDELSSKIEKLSDERTKLRAVWETEKRIISDIAQTREQLESLKLAQQKAEDEGDFETAARIKHKDILENQTKLQTLISDLEKNHTNVILAKESVDKDLITEMVADITGIPVTKITEEESKKLLNLEDELRKRVIGQDPAISAIAQSVRRSRTGLHDAGKPIGSFIFLGTTGVGKTELAKALAEVLFDDEKNMIRIDMSEYQEKHAVSRLIGSPPGYVGHDDGGQLTEAVRNKQYAVVLLDEVEKAHPDIFGTFLQVLDDGRLTDSKGRTVDFKNTIVIMTSNAGAEKITENFKKMTSQNAAELMEKTKNDVTEELKKVMRPEFLNRIDDIIMFAPLSFAVIRKITDLQLNSLIKKLKRQEINLYVSPAASAILSRLGYNPQFGARPVKRTIQRQLLNVLSEKILKGEVDKARTIAVDFADNKLTFTNVSDTELASLKEKSAAQPEKSEQEIVVPAEQTAASTTDKPGFWKRLGNWFRRVF